MELDPGQLRHRVQIQAATETNTAGEVSEAWRTVARWWAKIEQGAGREFFRAKQVNADMTHLVTMRRYPNLTPRHRLLWGTRTLHIDAIAEDETASWQTVQCREVV